MARISVGEALARYRQGQRVAFVDARREGDWRRATDKLPGATRLAPDPDDTLPMLPAARTAVVYCTSPGEASSFGAAELLRAGGYGDVRVLTGGLGAWRRAGGPTEPVRAVRPAIARRARAREVATAPPERRAGEPPSPAAAGSG